MALEGKELEGKIGDMGSYSVDITDKGMVEAQAGAEKKLGTVFEAKLTASAKLDVIEGLKALAQKSGNAIVIGGVNALAAALGR